MVRPPVALAVVFVLAILPLPVVAQQGQDDLWEVTTKMEMAGMPFAMPPQTSRVCTQKGKQNEAMAPQDKNCRMTDMRQSGNRTTFKIVCEGKDRMTGTADFTHGVDSYQGVMRFQGVMEGQQVDMTQNISGRKVGGCTWEDPSIRVRQMQKQQEDTKAAMCRDAMNKLQVSAFTGEAAICKEYHGQFLNRVSEVAAEMRHPAGFDRWVRAEPTIQQILQYGRHDPNAIWAAACNEAGATRNWTFVANYCDAQARQIALQECAGRHGTNVQTFEYAPICMRYRQDPAVMQGGGRVPPARQPAPGAIPQPAQASPTPVQYPPQAQPGAQYPAQGPAAGPQTPGAAPQAPPPAAAPAPQEPSAVEKGIGIFKGLFGR
jgi:hypothetical protein